MIKYLLLALLGFLGMVQSAQSQTTVHSLLELKPFLKKDSVHVKLAPGDYYLSAADVASGDWGEDIPYMDWAKGLFIFTGSHCTFDFTGATIYFNTDLFTAFGNKDIWEIEFRGNYSTYKNLTMVDDGSVYDAPTKGVTNVHVDGKHNIVDGFHITGKGSSPYAWGDSFGKGAGSLVKLQKHSALTLRGDYNTVKNTTIIHRAYGHCLVMQAANNPTIDSCYIEGEMRSTDDMLADPTIMSPPTTTWGYRLPSGYMKALTEEGIRTYNRGETLIDGEYIERGTNDITIKNTTVKNARGGCSIVLSSGFRHVENVTLIGNEFGFSVGDAKLINCRADAVYGPAYMNAYDDKRNKVTGDLTILAPSDGYYNGTGAVAFLGGENSDLNIYAEEGAYAEGLVIKVGGKTHNVGQLRAEPHTAANNTITNHTNFPLHIAAGSTGNTIKSCGDVTDKGTNNSITQLTDCAETTCHYFAGKEAPLGATPGLRYYQYEGNWEQLPRLDTLEPSQTGKVDAPSFTSAAGSNGFLFRFLGFVYLDQKDSYTFTTNTSLTHQLYIDGVKVADQHGSSTTSSGTVCLEAGYHRFRLDIMGSSADETIEILYESATSEKQPLTTYYIQETADNLAKSGTATQSSTAYDGVASRAIDGNTNGSFGAGSVTHTSDEHQPWWQVDLGGNKRIQEIKIYNRTDRCCSNRLQDFTVTIFDSDQREVFSRSFTTAPNPSLLIPVELVKGRVVRVQLNNTGTLNLAEVQVIGYDVEKSQQTIDFPELTEKTVGDPDFDPGATASSGLAVIYTSSNESVATVVENKISIVGGGTAQIIASQPGDDTYHAAAEVSQTLVVKDPQKQEQTITIEAFGTVRYGDSPLQPEASVSSGLAVEWSSSNESVATVVENKIHIKGVGSTQIIAFQAGNQTYNPATAERLLTVDKATQSISFDPIPEMLLGDSSYMLSANTSSGLEVAFQSDDEQIAKVEGNLLVLLQAGTTTITATQPGNELIAAAPAVTHQLVVKLSQEITFEPLPVLTVGESDYLPQATASSGLAVTYSSSDTSVAVIVGGHIRAKAPGVTLIKAMQAGDETYAEAPVEKQNLIVMDAEVLNISPDQIAVYPNPATTTLLINTNGGDFNYYQLSNTAGQVVASGTITLDGATVVSLEHLPPGVYLVQLSGQTSQELFKVVKK
ncbi:galactose-binding domain-containing protein [Marinoscillum furvescens]|uniref:Putative secreted protein (Por secretion system target) n=1 Tax=Marinoscillum furvescens DSM 4134 TaxID=1122208 RepID=A0A3D9L472_MARFU|nr:discoidin domain-containing protein [Marinoscillum furvescens]RED98371.1 putative secreted protein (Por secretion system target) [Marinoscillum furvescens DSM 4134]